MKNKIALAHVKAFEFQGTVADMIRTAITSKKWGIVGEAYGELLDTYGKRTRVKGTKEFTSSTPADTFNTQIQSVTKDMDCGKLKPQLIEMDDGSEQWGLVPVSNSKTKSSRTKQLSKMRESYVSMVTDLSDEAKLNELKQLAEMMGIKIQKGATRKSKAKAKTSNKLDKTDPVKYQRTGDDMTPEQVTAEIMDFLKQDAA